MGTRFWSGTSGFFFGLTLLMGPLIEVQNWILRKATGMADPAWQLRVAASVVTGLVVGAAWAQLLKYLAAREVLRMSRQNQKGSEERG